MKVWDTTFIKSATKPAHYPSWEMNEVAFAGTSNVGKSSLMNTLLRRRKLVKVSRTPGRTQLINFFSCKVGQDAREIGLVDLPGYGFARVPLSVKAQWGKMMEGYLQNRRQLKALVLLMDIRRGMKDDDRQLLESLAWYGVQPILVLTKADKFSRNQRRNQVQGICKELGLPKSEVVVFSSHTGLGRDRLWERINELVLPSQNLQDAFEEFAQQEAQSLDEASEDEAFEEASMDEASEDESFEEAAEVVKGDEGA
jgi:GTP-binding protein